MIILPKIFCLTLKDTPKRREYAEQHFKQHGLEVEFFNGINGKKFGLKTIIPYKDDNPDSGVDYALYDDLKPSLATFGKDGKMMLLSNPKGPIGLLYDLHENRQEDPTTLIMRLPTWLTNPNIDKDWLDGQKKKDPQEFQMQYGAEFGASSSDPMFMSEDIDRMFKSQNMVKRKEMPDGLFEYFCHIDPARTSDYYAIVIAHTETMYGTIGPDHTPLKRVVIDHIHFWNPLTRKSKRHILERTK